MSLRASGLGLFGLFLLGGIGGTALVACHEAAPAAGTSDERAGLRYEGACTRDVCKELPVPDLGCEWGAPIHVCIARNGDECAVEARCPGADDPNSAQSMSPCDDAECGPKPTTATEACPGDLVWGGSTCGKLNGNACAWVHGCTPPNENLDWNEIGPDCDQAQPACPERQECLTLAGLQGAHCIGEPCAALSCPAERCVVLESSPPQYVCE